MYKKLILIFMVAIIPWYIGMTNSYATEAEQPQDLDQPTDIMNDALDAINDAEAAGANVGELVDQFNTAVGMNTADQGPNSPQCGSPQECVADANQTFESIVDSSQSLKAAAIKLYYEELILGQLIAILLAFGLSFAGVFLYNQYRQYELNRFLQMEIKEN